MVRVLFALCLVMSLLPLSAQNVVASNSSIRTCVVEKECYSINNPGYLFYDERKNSFYLKIDPKEIRKSDPESKWLNDLGDSAIYFKGYFPVEMFPSTANNTSATHIINGQSHINGIWKNQTVEITFFAEGNTLVNPSITGTQYDAYRVNFSFSFLPVDYDLEQGLYNLRNPVYIAVTQGRINELKQGMEHLVGEAYDHD